MKATHTWSMLVTTPIWLMLMAAVLAAHGDTIPFWVWVLYWAYVPACLVGRAIENFAKG